MSRLWEGDPCANAADCSGTGQGRLVGDDLYLVVQVTRRRARHRSSTQTDCKRHWRTDSVEIAIDPRGTSENTSTTFKTGILPATAEGGPCFERDADNHQGPGAETAPGMQVRQQGVVAVHGLRGRDEDPGLATCRRRSTRSTWG